MRGWSWILAIAVVVGGCGAAPTRPEAGSAPAATATSAARPMAPALQAKALDGSTVALADLRGSVVVLDVMASWCTTCVEILPRWQALAERLRQRPARILLVSQDEDLGALRALVTRAAIHETVLVDEGEVWWNAFSLRFVPTAIVIGADGGIAGQIRNLAEGGFERLEALIDAELARAATSDAGSAPPPRRRHLADRRGN